MDLSHSFDVFVPAQVRDRFDWAETRDAAAVLASANADAWADVVAVLEGFAVDVDRDIRSPGGNESGTAAALNEAFRSRGWREAKYRVAISSSLTRQPYAPAGESAPVVEESSVETESYLVDNLKGRVALDVEWHAKDGNLDRDLAAYRALYDAGLVSAAVIVTMHRAELREWAVEVLGAESTKYATSTTTNLEKVRPKLIRGDGGGCPVLVAAVCRRTV